MKKILPPLLVAVGLIGSASASVLTGDLTNGLISFYSFNGSYNDSIGGNNIINVSDISFTTNRFGIHNSAIIFNSSSSSAQSINNLGIYGNNSRTISLQLEIPTSLFGGAGIIGFGANGTAAGQALIVNSYLQYQYPDTPNIQIWGNYASSQTIQLQNFFDIWHHFTYVYDGSVSLSRIYIDGNLVSTLPEIHNNQDYLNTADTPLTFGSGFFAAIPNAKISDLGIWNTALSSTEVSQLYALQSVPEPSTYALFGLGAIGVLMVMRRKKMA